MAKRLTDTDKWRDEWWGSLNNDYRIIWLYLVDSCTHSGIWKKDFRGLNFNCNVQITEDEFKKVFSERVIDKGNFFFIPKFLRFQYSKGLKSKQPVIISVLKELEINNLMTMVSESLGNGFLTIKDKDMDMDKDKLIRVAIQELEKEVFSDEIWLEQVAIAHKGKNIKQAWSECYLHHSQKKDFPKLTHWEWRQKLNTWLTIKKPDETKKIRPNPGKI